MAKRRTRRERKIYNEGKAAGYVDGYAQGLHDGNPFNALIEGLNKMVKTVSETVNSPEFIQMVKEAKEAADRGEPSILDGYGYAEDMSIEPFSVTLPIASVDPSIVAELREEGPDGEA